MHHAAAGGELGAVKVLIGAGARVDVMDPYRYRPLHLAARQGFTEICKLLVRHGADPRARIDVGFTAADLAQDQFPTLAEYLRAEAAP
jgi:ankyrin repeat protein